MITVSAFHTVPPIVKGLVRDLRVRWALEEAGFTYESKLIGPADQASAAYRAMQPFGQVPEYEEDGLVLFESAAIVLHIGERCETLLPRDPVARARAITWMFAAINSVEQYAMTLFEIDFFPGDEVIKKARRPGVEQMVQRRMAELTTWLDDKDYLEGRFTAGDLLMTAVLRMLRHTDLVEQHPKLKAYKDRCEARPAFQRALKAHMADFTPG